MAVSRQGACLHCVEAGHSFVEAMAENASTSAQRIRIGLTGLAFAFLLVLLGSVISRSGSDDNAVENRTAAANDAEPTEPLAELGVAPGTAGEDPNSNGSEEE